MTTALSDVKHRGVQRRCTTVYADYHLTFLLLKYKLLNKTYFKNSFTQLFFGMTPLSCRVLLWKFAILHEVSFPGWWPVFLKLSRNVFSHVHPRLLHEFFCLPIDLFMSKIYLRWAGAYLKNHCTYGHADTFYRRFTQPHF